jgi:hypothetical protein
MPPQHAGHFQFGNKSARGGNPFAGNREKWRSKLNKCVTDNDFEVIADVTIKLARGGEEWAVKEVWDRLMGKATQTLEVDARVNVAQVWEASADDLIALARQAGMIDQLPPRLRALAEAPEREVIDTTAREVAFPADACAVPDTIQVDSPTLPVSE